MCENSILNIFCLMELCSRDAFDASTYASYSQNEVLEQADAGYLSHNVFKNVYFRGHFIEKSNLQSMLLRV